MDMMLGMHVSGLLNNPEEDDMEELLPWNGTPDNQPEDVEEDYSSFSEK